MARAASASVSATTTVRLVTASWRRFDQARVLSDCGGSMSRVVGIMAGGYHPHRAPGPACGRERDDRQRARAGDRVALRTGRQHRAAPSRDGLRRRAAHHGPIGGDRAGRQHGQRAGHGPAVLPAGRRRARRPQRQRLRVRVHRDRAEGLTGESSPMQLDPQTIGTEAMYKLMIGCVVPRPIAWVSSVDAEGVANLAPFSYFMAITHDPPTIAFSASPRAEAGGKRGKKDTLRNVEVTREFVVNMVDDALAEQMN